VASTLDTPVLIAGGGPTGLVLASVLAQDGINCTLAERNPSTTRFPKMDITNGVSMELLRRLGVDEHLRQAGVAPQHSFDVIFAPGLNGPEVARWRLPSVDEQRASLQNSRNGTRPGQPWLRLSQALFEAVMMQRCQSDPLIDVRQGWRLDSCAQADGAVHAVLANSDGEELTVRAKYLIGCDGASSQVRNQLGIQTTGVPAFTTLALVHFRSSDLANLHALGQFWHLFCSTGVAVIAQDEIDTWTLHVDLGPDVTEDDPIGDPREFVSRALGRTVAIEEILACSLWGPNAQLADSYGRGRILLAGDAVHTMIPTGGYGMNTGLGDAFNLGWKLAAVVSGWGGQRLLDSYEAERRPIGERNRDASLENAGVHLQYRFMADADLVTADAPEGAAHRATLAEFLNANDGENTSLGVELDVRYDDSPIVCAPDTSAPPWDRRSFVPTVRAGHRAPNIVVEPDHTLFDDFGPGFTLVDPCNHPDAKQLIDEAALVGMPLHHLVLEDAHCRALYQDRLVLVRPDLHIAWSGHTVTDAAAIIGRASGAV
jgi:2-polyprenyl-6-methoxyphenol hydroxylase-like FAD-dependent oxidoreductase